MESVILVIKMLHLIWCSKTGWCKKAEAWGEEVSGSESGLLRVWLCAKRSGNTGAKGVTKTSQLCRGTTVQPPSWHSLFRRKQERKWEHQEESFPQEVINSVPHAVFSLAPIIFLMFIYFSRDRIRKEGCINMLADGLKIQRTRRNREPMYGLHMDVTKLGDSSHKWQMEFNAEKCLVMTTCRVERSE